MKTKGLKFIDLFSGIGGFRVALETEGLQCVFSSEIDEKTAASYKANFGEKPSGDITSINVKKIPSHDILCAGFPCQSFSISGKSKGFDDDRGRLFYEIVRIADYHKPQILLLENVRNILTLDSGKIISTIRKKLEKIGYSLSVNLLNSSHFGIPQSRERVYFVGLRNDKHSKALYSFRSPFPKQEEVFLDSILDPDPDPSLIIKRPDIHIEKKNVDNRELKPIRIGYVNKGGQGERIYSDKGHAITLSAYGGGVGARTGLYLIDGKVRKLSIDECKRLMGFPDSHIVGSGIQGYQELGNAVIPTMIQKVFRSISFE